MSRRRRVLDDMDEDIRDHLERETRALIDRGMTPEAARTAARRKFGNVALVKEAVRAVWISIWWDQFLQDVGYAVRMFRRAPGFSAVAVLTLALGIGATTAVFSVVYGVLVRPLPYPEADRLVRVWEEHPGGTTMAGNRWISNRTYFAWIDRPRTIEVLGGYGNYETTVRIADDDLRMFGAEVSPALLAALGARPILGRLFRPKDADEKASPTVILSEELWRSRFSSDAGVIGRSVTIDGEGHSIVGVLSTGFAFPDHRARFWTPHSVERVSTDPARSQRTSGLLAIARIASRATAAQVEAEGTAAARSVPVTQSTQVLFGKGGPPVVHARLLVSDMTQDVKPALLLFAAAVGCLLAIACVNVGNLSLARGVARQRELTFRAALGAGRGRLGRQLLTESAVLSCSGGVLGVGLAFALIRTTAALAPTRFPRLADVRLDAYALSFTVAVALLAVLLSGLIPALRGARFGSESLRGGDGGSTAGFRGAAGTRLRDALLVAESAFTVMLLVGAILLARSFVRLTSVDAGYTAEHVLTARALMPRDAKPEHVNHVIDTVLDRLRAIPGVAAAGAGSMMPMLNVTAVHVFSLPDDTGRGQPTETRTLVYDITPGYAEALRLRLRAGRFFDDRDAGSVGRPMIVNAEFARRYLSGARVIGRRFSNLLAGDKAVTTEIVGLVGDVLKDGNDRQPQPEVYWPHGSPARRIRGAINLVVRTAGDASAVAGTLRQLLREADPAVILERVEMLEQQVSASVAQPRFRTVVVGTFAGLALTLACVGLYGVLAYTVSQRRRELGMRAALGATRAGLVGLVIREGLAVTAAGIAIGLAGAGALSRLLQTQLFGVRPLDLLSFAGAAAVLFGVAVLACLIPASRAAAIDPAEALRCE